MRVLVTGGSGFIGSNLIDHLIEKGYEVENIDLQGPGHRVDVRNLDSLMKFVGRSEPDVIVHLAAVASVTLCEKKRHDCYTTNVLGTRNIAKVAAQYGVRVVFSSSSAVYGNGPARVSLPPKPANYYGLTKKEGEEILKDELEEVVILRIFNAYGPKCSRSYFIPDFIRKAVRGGRILLLGTGDEARDFIYVGDVARAIELSFYAPPGTYNVGTGRLWRIRRVAELLADLLRERGYEASFSFTGYIRPGEFAPRAAAMEDAVPRWTPEVKLRDGLELTVDWYLRGEKHGEWIDGQVDRAR